MDYRRAKSKFQTGGANVSIYPYYNRNHIRNNGIGGPGGYINKKRMNNTYINHNNTYINNNRPNYYNGYGNYNINNTIKETINNNTRSPNFNNNTTDTISFKTIQRKENLWHFTPEELNTNTPSIKDGYTLKDELKQRWKACAFIMSIGMTMKLPQTTIATACTYLHRFYCRKSLKYYPPYEIAASSIYLASKVTDAQRKLKDVIIVCISKAQKNAKLNINEKTHEFEKWKRTILYHELEVLETICYDVVVDHPYNHLLNMMEKLNEKSVDHSALVRLAWCFINDSYKTTMCLKYSPEIIAACALYMACKYTGTVLVDKSSTQSPTLSPITGPWWKSFQINENELLNATSELAEVYMKIIKKNVPSINADIKNNRNSIQSNSTTPDSIQMNSNNETSMLSPENINTSSSMNTSPSP